MPVGILAVQGGFAAHVKCLQALGQETVLVKTPWDLARCKSLILPGGESTAIYHLMQTSGLTQRVRDFKGPILATCAGTILLSCHVEGTQPFTPLGRIDISVRRNAYGRQLQSFVGDVELAGDKCKGVFIRAPKIIRLGFGVEVLGRFGVDPVFVRQKNISVATFHPELVDGHSFYSGVIETQTAT